MRSIKFAWDGRKNKLNCKKHGVSFEEAQTVFRDELALEYFDPDHSSFEDRFILLGISAQFRVLVVCHCFRKTEQVIRVISARKADRQEQKNHWENRK